MTTFTLEALEAKVRDLAAANPDHVYNPSLETESSTPRGCFYRLDNHEHKHRCIIGQALFELTNREVSQQCEGKAASSVLKDEFHVFAFADSTTKWLDDVQKQQDTGWTWGDAIKQADAYRKRLSAVQYCQDHGYSWAAAVAEADKNHTPLP